MSSKYYSKTDANQASIVRAFRALGCGVHCCHAVGGGFPDLLVEIAGLNILVEVKDPSQPPSNRRLTPAQIKFHSEWRGMKSIVLDTLGVANLVSQVREHQWKCKTSGLELDIPMPKGYTSQT